MKYEDMSNADLLRTLHQQNKIPHSNKNIREFIRTNYGRDIKIQQIAQDLGRYKERPLLRNAELDDLARRFLVACQNDIGLCRRILNRYRGVPCHF